MTPRLMSRVAWLTVCPGSTFYGHARKCILAPLSPMSGEITLHACCCHGQDTLALGRPPQHTVLQRLLPVLSLQTSHCSNDLAVTYQPPGQTVSMQNFLPTAQFVCLTDSSMLPQYKNACMSDRSILIELVAASVGCVWCCAQM